MQRYVRVRRSRLDHASKEYDECSEISEDKANQLALEYLRHDVSLLLPGTVVDLTDNYSDLLLVLPAWSMRPRTALSESIIEATLRDQGLPV